MKRLAATLLAAAAFLACGPRNLAAAPEPTTEEQKTMYALGLALSENLKTLRLTEDELNLVISGLSDGVLKRTAKVDLRAYAPKLSDLAQARLQLAIDDEKARSAAYLGASAGNAALTKTASGMFYQIVEPGAGAAPTAADTVKVHYTGTLVDGKVFDTSRDGAGEPVTFGVGQVIPCWSEGLLQMKVGGKAKLVCPAELAYGERGAPPDILPGATLLFDVELLAIEPKTPAPAPATPPTSTP